MMFRTVALAVALTLGSGMTTGVAFAAKKTYKAKKIKTKRIKPKKDPRYKNSHAAAVKPRKAKKRSHS